MNLLAAETCTDTAGYVTTVSVHSASDQLRKDILSILKEAIVYFSSAHKQKGMTSKSPEDIQEYILNNILLVDIDNTYLIGLDTIESYMSTDKILSEEFIYKYGNSSGFKSIVSVMDNLANTLSCNKIMVGTLACNSDREHRALSRLYQREGFTIQSIILGKD